ncbi:hypothetical protein ABQG71_06290 [Bacillus altitudinis]|uniref:Uncharacterized protein n=1 Tax=Bacillus altitudinis TaxID=293387 RepID=A0ABV1S3J4_BACAB
MKITLEINGENKVFEMPTVKTRLLRKALELQSENDLEKMTVGTLDKLVEFTAVAFGKQFTADDLYDGLEADKLNDTLTDVMNAVSGVQTEGASEVVEDGEKN